MESDRNVVELLSRLIDMTRRRVFLWQSCEQDRIQEQDSRLQGAQIFRARLKLGETNHCDLHLIGLADGTHALLLDRTKVLWSDTIDMKLAPLVRREVANGQRGALSDLAAIQEGVPREVSAATMLTNLDAFVSRLLRPR